MKHSAYPILLRWRLFSDQVHFFLAVVSQDMSLFIYDRERVAERKLALPDDGQAAEAPEKVFDKENDTQRSRFGSPRFISCR